MATLTIRNLDDRVKQALREQAARHGVSMEEEVRNLLGSAIEPPKKRKLGIQTVAFDMTEIGPAREAYRLFGRGSGHAAALNMGDCFSYALAKTRDLPLLFKGDDFIHTDIRSAQAEG